MHIYAYMAYRLASAEEIAIQTYAKSELSGLGAALGGSGMRKFRWQTMDGQILTPPEMETTHLFYVIRMVYNHTVPPALRLPGGHWKEAEEWTPETKRRILIEMIKELAKRDDLPFALDVQLSIMRERCRQFGGTNYLLN